MAEQDPDGGALAGTVGAEQTDDGAARHAEAHVVERRRLTETLGDAVETDGGAVDHTHARPPSATACTRSMATNRSSSPDCSHNVVALQPPVDTSVTWVSCDPSAKAT